MKLLWFVAAVLFVAVITLVGNIVAQRLMPTRISDEFAQRYGYGLLVKLISVAIIGTIAGLAILLGL